MGFIKRYKGIIMAVAVITIAVLAYTVFFRNSSENNLDIALGDIITPEVEINNDLIGLLLELRVLTLDQSLFDDERFKSLSDFSVTLQPQPIGRRNPFLPLGIGEGAHDEAGDSVKDGDSER
jgi:hypothetical protein